jgi:hypothetical protein
MKNSHEMHGYLFVQNSLSPFYMEGENARLIEESLSQKRTPRISHPENSGKKPIALGSFIHELEPTPNPA